MSQIPTTPPVPSDDALLALNQPGQIIEVTPELAARLGAFEETALSEPDALDADQQTVD